MRKIILFLVVLSLLIGQSVLAAEGFEDVSLEPEYELCCGEQSLIEGLHESLIQKRMLETQPQFCTDLVQPISIMPTLKGIRPMPSTGNVKMLVLPISYLDSRQYEEKFDVEEWERHFFAPYDSQLKPWEQSVRGFYYRESYGKLDITGTVLPVYRAPLTGKAYDDDSTLANEMYTEALTYYCEQGLDISQFDNDGDGVLDALIIHQLRLGHSTEFYVGAVRGVQGSIGEYDIDTAALIYSRYLREDRVYEHEIGHLLGLLDNYNPPGVTNNNVLNSNIYELMYGSGYINAYYKYLLNWIDPIILTNDDSIQTIELSPVESLDNGFDLPPKAVILIPNSSAFPFTEYYIAEYRAGGVKEPRKEWADLIYDLNPGIVIWHCNTFLNMHKQYKYQSNYLKPVHKSGDTNYSEKDIYVEGDEFSSSSTPNSNFYDDVYTGAYLKVEEITLDKAILQVGFREPDLTPVPVIEVSPPSKTVISKKEKSTVVVTVKLGDELFPPDLIDPYDFLRASATGTVFPLPWASALRNPCTITIDGYAKDGTFADGTVWIDIPAGTIRYNGKDSAAVTSEKIYVDNTPPEIALQGTNPQRIQQGMAYTELGAVASDNLDPNIEDKLEIDASQVNTADLGSYTVTYSVTDHAGHTATAERTVIVEPHTHSYSERWESDESGHWHECECGERLDFAAHDAVTDPAEESTCTAPGKTEGSHCSDCGYVIAAQTEAPLTAHSYSEDWNQDAANHWHECEVCKEKTAQAPHTWDGGVVTTAPTSSKTGVRTYTCIVCAGTKTEAIPATGGGSSGGSSGVGGKKPSATVTPPPAPGEDTPAPPAPVEEEPPPPEDPAPAEFPFEDVRQDAWYRQAVEYAYEKGIMTGVSDRLFAPETMTSRGMVVTMLYRMEGEPTVKTQEDFTDVPVGRYYADAVAWAVENGIVTGYGDGTFRPDIGITREQLVTILYRYSDTKGYTVTQRASLSDFFDAGRISPYAREPLAWANATGLLGGTDWGGIDPGGSATRGQVAAILSRFLINYTG